MIGLRLLLVHALVVVVVSTDSTDEVVFPPLEGTLNPSLNDPTRHWRSWQRSLQQAVSDSNATTISFDVQSICAVVEQSFSQNVTCKCAGTVVDNFSITCDYPTTPICNAENRTCGVPQLALAMVHGQIFSATTCLSHYRRGAVALSDTCLFVDACVPKNDEPDEDLPLFCGCTASYGGAICQSCHICDGAGTSISLDCSNVNAEAVSTACTPLDVDLHLDGGAGALAGFAPPSFSGFCSALEGALDNRIACDCSTAVGGSYTVTCRTIDACDNCDETVVVESNVAVVEGTIRSVTACAASTGGGTTCTTVELCEDDDAICGCSATYNGHACNSCTLCDAVSEQSIRMDCSNGHASAVSTECQAITVSSSYEFVPHFQEGTNPGSISLPTSAATTMTGATRRTTVVVLGTSLFGFTWAMMG